MKTKKNENIVLVCGGRAYDNQDRVFEVLDKLDKELGGVDIIIQGGAGKLITMKEGFKPIGADLIAMWWAKARGIDNRTFKAKWHSYGKAAGMIRNKEMLNEGKPNLVVAFPGGKGTANMIKQAKKANIRILEVLV